MTGKKCFILTKIKKLSSLNIALVVGNQEVKLRLITGLSRYEKERGRKVKRRGTK